MSKRQQAIVLIASAFLPYLPGGLRPEHVVFTALALAGGTAFALGRNRLPTVVLLSALCLGASLVPLAVNSAILPTAGADASIVGSFIRLLLPVFICVGIAATMGTGAHATRDIARAIVLVAAPVGLVSGVSAITDVSGWLGPWVRGGDESVWAQAFAVGRFTGIFNQPLEAGVFFSVALLAAIYLLADRPRHRMRILLAVVCILIGGMLSLSKNFIVLGLGISLVMAIRLRVISIPGALLMLGGGLTAIVVAIWRLNEAYVTSLLDLLDSGGLVLALTAGRFGGDDTDVGQLFAALQERQHWVSGFGLGAHLPLDNGYLEYFYQGGAFALAGFLAWIALLGGAAALSARSAERALLHALMLFVIVASLGGPVITANRANVALLALVVTAAGQLGRRNTAAVNAAPRTTLSLRSDEASAATA